MRLLPVLFVLTACEPSYSPSMPLGGRDVPVAIADCVEPQRGWVSEEVTSFGWHAADTGEVTVRCADTGDMGGAGMFVLGTHEVLVDPVKAPGEFAARAVAGHELVHWLIDKGPHPERARLHLCDLAYNETAGPGCAPGFSATNALMSPSLGGTAAWSGDSESITPSGIAEYRVTDADQAFLDWALKP